MKKKKPGCHHATSLKVTRGQKGLEGATGKVVPPRAVVYGVGKGSSRKLLQPVRQTFRQHNSQGKDFSMQAPPSPRGGAKPGEGKELTPEFPMIDVTPFGAWGRTAFANVGLQMSCTRTAKNNQGFFQSKREDSPVPLRRVRRL